MTKITHKASIRIHLSIGAQLVAHFARLRKVRQVLPLKELQFELLWLMTVDTVERLPGMYRHSASELALQLARHLTALFSTALQELQVRELLVHACLKVASMAPGSREEGSASIGSTELAEVTELLKCHAPIVLEEQSRPSVKGGAPLVKGQLQLAAVWQGFLRCVAALPPQCPHGAALKCCTCITEVLPILFRGSSAAHAEGAVSLAMAVRRQQSLPAHAQAALLRQVD